MSSAWFVGYTPQLSTAVMYVRGDGDDQLDGWLPSYFGADYPADTWTAIMRRDMEGVAGRGVPAAGEPRRRRAGGRPRAVHPTAAAPDQEAVADEDDQDAGADSDPDRADPRRADRPTEPTSEPTCSLIDCPVIRRARTARILLRPMIPETAATAATARQDKAIRERHG